MHSFYCAADLLVALYMAGEGASLFACLLASSSHWERFLGYR